MSKIRCQSCGKKIDEALCPYCGTNNSQPSGTIKAVAGVTNGKTVYEVRLPNRPNGQASYGETPVQSRSYLIAGWIFILLRFIAGFFLFGPIVSLLCANKSKKENADMSSVQIVFLKVVSYIFLFIDIAMICLILYLLFVFRNGAHI